MSAPKYTGSCHCGSVKYEVTIPEDKQVLSKCNCTMCQKPHFATISLGADKGELRDADGKVNATPPTSTHFKLISPKSLSEVRDYRPKNPSTHRFFCDKCGVQFLGCGRFEAPGTDMVYEYFGVNANTLDQPQDGLDLRKWKIVYYDGLNNNWMAGDKTEPWEGGVV